MVYVEIKLEYDSKRIFEKFKRAALQIPHLLECHLLSGDFDYLMKIRVADMAEYRQLLVTSCAIFPELEIHALTS